MTLEPDDMTLIRRDGVDFGRMQGARKERCFRIVTDEQRRSRPKAARPCGVSLGSTPNIVASLVRATSPACAPFLVGELPRPITVDQCHVIRL